MVARFSHAVEFETLRFIEEGRLQFATVEFAGRSITVGRPVATLAAA